MYEDLPSIRGYNDMHHTFDFSDKNNLFISLDAEITLRHSFLTF